MTQRTRMRGIGWSDNGLVMRKVRSEANADGGALRITLFRGARGDTCGWYIGPLGAREGRFSLPYLPRSQETLASVAVVRAIEIARDAGEDICLVDPDDLWDSVWGH